MANMKFWVLVLITTVSVAGAIVRDYTYTICNNHNCNCVGSDVTCDCLRTLDQELNISSEADYQLMKSATRIYIKNCDNVNIEPHAFRHLPELKSVTINNVRNLVLNGNSFDWKSVDDYYVLRGIEIQIHNTTIPSIPSHTFKGRIENIIIKECNVKDIKPFAFANLKQTNKIAIVSSNVESIDTQAFKKIILFHFIVIESSFNIIPSRFLSDMHISLLHIENTKAERIRSSAFIVFGVRKFTFIKCNIDTIEGDAFRITSQGPITVRNNSIKKIDKDAFAGLAVESDFLEKEGLQILSFLNNNVSVLESGALKLNQPSFVLKLHNLMLINNSCECQSYTKVPKSYDISVFCVGNINMSPNDWTYMSIYSYQVEKCNGQGNAGQGTILAVSISIIVVMMLIGGLLTCWYIRGKRNKRICLGSNYSLEPPPTPLRMVVPEGNTYKESETHIILEKAEILTTDL